MSIQWLLCELRMRHLHKLRDRKIAALRSGRPVSEIRKIDKKINRTMDILIHTEG